MSIEFDIGASHEKQPTVASPVDPVVSCELNLLSQADAKEQLIRQQAKEVLNLKHRFLTANGWEITGEMLGLITSYFYQKFGELFICEDEAIDRQLNSN